MKPISLFLIISISLTLMTCAPALKIEQVDVLVIGGGTGGTAAGIQAARTGVKTLVIEPSPWLGGMLTAAGVSATDGNHHMPAGLWGEFRSKIRDYYGGAEAIATGWISHTLFEPSVGATIFQELAAEEPQLEVWFEADFNKVAKIEGGW